MRPLNSSRLAGWASSIVNTKALSRSTAAATNPGQRAAQHDRWVGEGLDASAAQLATDAAQPCSNGPRVSSPRSVRGWPPADQDRLNLSILSRLERGSLVGLAGSPDLPLVRFATTTPWGKRAAAITVCVDRRTFGGRVG